MAEPIVAFITGGAANADPQLSLGGAISTTEPTMQINIVDSGAPVEWNDMLAVTGSFGMESGIYQGTTFEGYILECDAGVLKLQARDSGDARYDLGTVGTGKADGRYIIPNGSGGGIYVDYTYVADTWDDYWDYEVNEPVSPNMFSNITKTQSTTGKTDYRCVAYKNTDVASIDLSIFLQDDANNLAATYSLGIDSIGVTSSGDAVNIATEVDIPQGVSFSEPLASTPLNLPVVAQNEYVYVWIRRVIPTNNNVYEETSLLNIQTTWV